MKKTWLISLVIIALGMASCSGGDDDKEPTYYTVTFDADGGTPTPAVQRVEAGKTASAPTNPSKSGYVFKSWQLSGSGAVYNFQTPITSNIMLQAKWEEEAKVEYWQVTWQLNGGAWPSAGDNHAVEVPKGGTLAEPAAPTKANATFEGWHKETELTNKINFPYDVSAVTSDFTLYAKWKDEGGGQEGDYKMFTSIAALSTWLGSQAENTAETPYKVGLKSVNMDSGNNWGDLGIVIGETNKTKYIDLDLSGCTGTTIPDGERTGSGGSIKTSGAFVNCDNMIAIKLPEGLQSIGQYSFYNCDGLTEITLPTSLKSMGKNAFSSCGHITAVNIPGIQIISESLFHGCKNLVSVTLNEGTQTIEENAFHGNDKLEFVTLPKGLKVIGLAAFGYCPAIKTITIPESVTGIRGKAFTSCTALIEMIMLSATPPTIGANSLDATHSTLKIKVPTSSLETYKTTGEWLYMASKIVANTD